MLSKPFTYIPQHPLQLGMTNRMWWGRWTPPSGLGQEASSRIFHTCSPPSGAVVLKMEIIAEVWATLLRRRNTCPLSIGFQSSTYGRWAEGLRSAELQYWWDFGHKWVVVPFQ